MTKNTDKKNEIIWTSDKNRIDPAMYTALSLDTSVVARASYIFDIGVLATLENQTMPVVISEIVDKEITKHLYFQRDEAVNKFKNAIENLYKKKLIPNDDFKQMQDIADKIGDKDPCVMYEHFKLYNDIKEIESNMCKMSDLITTYFNSQPPFDEGKNIKEFPDAIALLSLEAWAKANDKKILVISNDKQWVVYSEGSHHIDVVNDLATGLQEIQIHVGEKQNKIRKIIYHFNQNKNQRWKLFIEDFLINAVPKTYIEKNFTLLKGLTNYVHVKFSEVKYQPRSFFIPIDQIFQNLLVLPSLENATNFIVKIHFNIISTVDVSNDLDNTDVVDRIEVNDFPVFIKAMFCLDGDVLVVNDIPNITNISIDGSIQSELEFTERLYQEFCFGN